MPVTSSMPKSFKAVPTEGANGAVELRLPFDPVAVWGKRARYHVGGTIDGKKMRAVIKAGDRKVVLGPMWRRDCDVKIGAQISVTLALEGPQQAELAPDFAAALKAEPKAAAFWDDLSQFYRKAYQAWIDATKKNPGERPRRIKETVKLLKRGQKERPK